MYAKFLIVRGFRARESLLIDLAAKADYGACCGWFGPGMAGTA